ncbi:substrate-binding domain-containing protein [Cupriavidus basilensis]|uniref:Substrate-binding domain-containing protein n=1 Tax=Cupriavidus basilensis TaxID=68895 RepID=A0ABT6B4K8_9BURK|nr:substrate-binding domain-containing protein [Cupriavidus basilensis]MDF3839748.1 substrate-binding domain-containing protein [Cupriavidus basilensis]
MAYIESAGVCLRPFIQRLLPAVAMILAGVATAAPAGDTGAASWAREGRPLPRPEFLQPRLDDALPVYQPCSAQPLRGALEGSVPAILPKLVQGWIGAFQQRHPGVRINAPPPYLAPQGALSPPLRKFLDGGSDFALVSRDMTASDVAAFQRAHGVPPQPVPVVGGAWRHFGFVDAIGVVVNETNPVKALTLEQLDAVFSKSRLRGHGPVRTWGDLGVAAWADRPVRVVGAASWRGAEASARAVVMQERVLSVGEARGQWRDDIAVRGTEADVPDQVAADPYAIGFTGMGHLVAGIRTVALAQEPDSVAVDATYEDVALARYPLARVAYLVPARIAGRSVDPVLREFIRFILSRDGQRIVLEQGVMLPLRAPQTAAALHLLGGEPDACGPPEVNSREMPQ